MGDTDLHPVAISPSNGTIQARKALATIKIAASDNFEVMVPASES
jgi:hypothetical protein